MFIYPSSRNARASVLRQVGMCVEHYQDDVWWKGLIIRKTPAGVHVYMPGRGFMPIPACVLWHLIIHSTNEMITLAVANTLMHVCRCIETCCMSLGAT